MQGMIEMEVYSDKYHLTRRQSIFLAKKKWDENIYCGMRMENRNVTFPQTQTILNGVRTCIHKHLSSVCK